MKDKHVVEIINKNTNRVESRLLFVGKYSKKRAKDAALSALRGSLHEIVVRYFYDGQVA